MKRHIVGVIIALTAATVPSAALAGLSPPSTGADTAVRNVISRMTAASAGDVAVLSVVGSQEPLFTIFKMENPPRLVVDIAHASVEGVKAPEVAGAAVADIALLQFDRAGSATGRIVIGLKGGVVYDAKVSGKELVILVGPKGVDLPKFTFGAASAAAPAQKPDAKPEARAEAKPEVKPVPSKVERPVPSKAETAVPPAATAQKPAAANGEPEYAIKPDPKDVKPVTVKDIRTRKVGDGKVEIAVVMDGPAAYGVMEIANPGRLALDIPSGKAAKALKKTVDLGKGPVAKVRVGAHDDKVRLVMDLSGDMPAYDVKAVGNVLTLTVGAAKVAKSVPVQAAKEEAKPAAPKAAPEKPAPNKVEGPAVAAVPKPEPEARQEVQPKPAVPKKDEKAASVEDVAFKQYDGYSRIAVRLSRNTEYRVIDGDGLTTALELKDSGIRKDLERTLDVSEIAGPVEAISSYVDKARPGEVMVVVKLREKAQGKVSADGATLNWDFAWTKPRRGGEVVEYQPEKTAGATSDVATATGTGATGKVYKGKRISLDFKEADIHNILRLISEVSKLNIVTSDDVKGRVTVTLRNVPWDEALDIILQSKGLGKKQVGNIIRVGPLEMFQREAEIELAKKKAQRNLEPLYVRLIPVNYGVASEIVGQVKDVLSERGTANIDGRTNVIIVKDMQENVIKAEGLVRNLDTQTPQVLIEARIVEANLTFARDVGIQWGGTLSFSPAHGNQTGLTFPNVVGISGGADDSRTMNPLNGTLSPGGFAVNMPAPVGAGSGGAIGFILGSAGGTANLNLRLSAMENTGDVKILSAPRVATLDNKDARIGQGISIPISQVSAAGVNTVFVEAKLELNVTPHVTQDGSILMKIATTKNEPDFSRTGASGDPTIIKKEASTEVLVKDGDTTVIGGIYTRRNSEQFAKVPLLANIPVIGWLFKKRTVSDERTELLIFITPRIINRSQSVVSTK